MKLSKTSWIFLVAAVLLIAGVSLSTLYSQKDSQQQQLVTKLNQSKKRLALIKTDDLTAKKSQLDRQIEQNTLLLQEAKSNLVYDKDNIDTINLILEDARAYQVTILAITSPGFDSGKLENISCQTQAFNIRATAENMNDLVAFTISLSQIFPTSLVSSVQISHSSPSPTPSTTPSPSPNPTTAPSGTPAPTPTPTPIPVYVNPAPLEVCSTDISLIIYSYKGG